MILENNMILISKQAWVFRHRKKLLPFLRKTEDIKNATFAPWTLWPGRVLAQGIKTGAVEGVLGAPLWRQSEVKPWFQTKKGHVVRGHWVFQEGVNIWDVPGKDEWVLTSRPQKGWRREGPSRKKVSKEGHRKARVKRKELGWDRSRAPAREVREQKKQKKEG